MIFCDIGIGVFRFGWVAVDLRRCFGWWDFGFVLSFERCCGLTCFVFCGWWVCVWLGLCWFGFTWLVGLRVWCGIVLVWVWVEFCCGSLVYAGLDWLGVLDFGLLLFEFWVCIWLGFCNFRVCGGCGVGFDCVVFFWDSRDNLVFSGIWILLGFVLLYGWYGIVLVWLAIFWVGVAFRVYVCTPAWFW